MRIGRNWTNEEEEYLIENWGAISVKTIAKNLGRSENAVVVRKCRLGLGAFLANGDYITWNQLNIALGIGNSGGYKMISWVRNRDFPIHTKKVNNNSFKVVYLDEWWEWAEKNKDLLDFSKFEKNVLGLEPEWVKEKRKMDTENSNKYIKTPWTSVEDSRLEYLIKKQKYTYRELSVMMRRTEGAIQRRICDLGLKERPVKADNYTRWTEQDFEMLGEMIKAGYAYEYMSEKLEKSAKAIRGRVYSMYLTENLDKARELIGTGSFGDNRPERKLKQWNVMDAGERNEARDLLTRLTAIIHNEFKEQLADTEWGEFFQKDICQNFCGDCLSTAGCDECENYKKIEPQACKMCGKTFFERKKNNFCSCCRNMRKHQYLRKRAALNDGKGRKN